MTKRMMLALLSLLGLFVALYLSMYKLGMLGELTCSVGSCEAVQASAWADFIGLPVAVWGAGFYVVALVLSIVALQPRFIDSRRISLALLLLTGWGFLFSAWLTYLELFVIQAICQWCIVSAIIVTIMFVVAWLEHRDTRTGSEGELVGGESSVAG